MRHSWAERWGPASGGASALLLRAAFSINPLEPGPDAAADDLTASNVDGASGILVSRFCAFLAAFAPLWFAATLRLALRTAATPSALVPDVAFGAGVATAALLVLSGFRSFAAASLGENLDATSLWSLFALDWSSHVPMALAASAVAAAAAVATFRDRALPRWLGAAPVAVAVACLTPPWLLGVAGFTAWAGVTAGVRLLHGRAR